MTRSKPSDFLESSSNPERILRSARKKIKEAIESSRLDSTEPNTPLTTPIRKTKKETEMAGQPARHTMEDLMKAGRQSLGHSITQPDIDQDFEIKGPILHLIKDNQFRGTPKEDANEHLRQFNDICNLFKIRAVEDETIYLRLFPWSLKDEAKDWLNSLPVGEITTWNKMVEKFLNRFFPASKTVNLQTEIANFRQKTNETLYEAWVRFGQLLRACPQHGLNNFQMVTTFYKGCDIATRREIDTSAGGNIMSKTADEAHSLIEKLAAHSHEWHEDLGVSRSVNAAGTDSDDLMKAMNVQLGNLGRQMEKITKEMHQMKIGCEKCGGPHLARECVNNLTMEQIENVSYANQGYQGGNPNYRPFNNYQAPYQNNFAPKNPPGFYPVRTPFVPNNPINSPAQTEKRSNVEDSILSFIKNQTEANEMIKNQLSQVQNNHQSSIQALERNVTKLFQLVEGKSNPSTEKPKTVHFEKANVIHQLGLVEDEDWRKGFSMEKLMRIDDNQRLWDDMWGSDEHDPEEPVIEWERVEPEPEADIRPLEAINYEMTEEEQELEFLEMTGRLQAGDLNDDGLTWADMEAMHGEPESDFEDDESEGLDAEPEPFYPPILTDPGEFHLPCIIRGPIPLRGLADIGASVNLMPFSLYDRLGLPPLESATSVLSLADNSVHRPIGVAKSVEIKVGYAAFLADFLVMDMPEDPMTPLILGRPFLATAKASIDFRNDSITLRKGGYSEVIPITPRSFCYRNSVNVIKDKCGEDSEELLAKIEEVEEMKRSLEQCLGREVSTKEALKMVTDVKDAVRRFAKKKEREEEGVVRSAVCKHYKD